MPNANDNNIAIISNKDARHMITRLYKNFNKLVVLLRPFGIRIQHPVSRTAIDEAVYDLEILLDEVRELTR